MKPTVKENLSNTYHRDGTVSYWSVYNQQWQRKCIVPNAELAAMNEGERRRILQHTSTN